MLKLTNIRKTYRKGAHEVQALRGISLGVVEGDYIAIMGPSGSGKSTLMHVLGLLDVPDSGSYQVEGREVSRLSEDALAALRRQVFGFVFQQFHLLSRMTALQNVSLPLLYSRRRDEAPLARELLVRMGLAHRLDHLPSELSGGQQQRVAIARALVNRPRFVLADEPTGDLDSSNEKEILDLLGELNARGITIVVVTHEEEVALRARRVIRMRDGLIQSDERLRGPVTLESIPPRDPAAPAPAAVAWLAGVKAYLGQGLATLLANKARTSLSTLGILMGVAAVVTMLALGRGAQRDVESQIASMGSNLLVLRTGAARVGAVSQEAGNITRITLDDVGSIKERVPLIREASPIVEGKIQATFQDRNWQTRILGTDSGFERIRAAEPQLGRFFTPEENRGRQRVALLGPTVARELFGDARSPIGERIRLNRVSFQVIGLLPPKGSSGWQDEDDVILVPVLTAMHRVLGKDYIDSVDLEVTQRDRMREAEHRVLEVMLARHRVGRSRFQTPFEVRNMARIKAALSQSSRTLSLLLAFIAVISLLVGGVGIMNIMLVSVTERTREIGLRKAIGALRADLLAQFLAESVVVTLMGGIAGILTGCLGAGLVCLVTGWSTSVSPGSIVLSFLFSVSIGIVFGVYPAKKASRLHPIEALRHD